MTMRAIPWRKVAMVCALPAVAVPCSTYYYYYHCYLPRNTKFWLSDVEPPRRKTPAFIAGGDDATHDAIPPVRDPRLLAPPTERKHALQSLFFNVRLWFRFLRVIFLSMPVALFAAARVMTNGDLGDVYVSFTELLMKLGPTYMKFGQWMATRPDLFPPLLCRKLALLFDSAPAHDWAFTERVLRSAINRDGTSLIDFLASVERVPVNSGSIAQIHKGVLKCDCDGVPAGSTVAIKVLHPNVREEIWSDVNILRILATLFNTVVPGGRYFDPLVHWYEFASFVVSQLDMDQEADNLEGFRYNFRNFVGVEFPKPLRSLTTPCMLVETFEEGEPLQSVKMSKPLADIGVYMFLKMIFEDNFIHSDLHPGNLLVRSRLRDGTLAKYGHPDGRTEMVCLDCGLVTALSKKDRENFILLFSAVACGDSNLAADLMLERSPSHQCADIPRFREGMRQIFEIIAPDLGTNKKPFAATIGARKDGFRLSEVKIGDVLSQIMNCMRDHKVAIDGHFATLVMTVIVGEGLGRSMHPDYNLFAAAAPFLVTSLEGHELTQLVTQLQSTYGVGVVRDLVTPPKLGC